MRKVDELQSGCMAKAKDDEMTFVLLGRDIAAPNTIRHWVGLRLAHGKNMPEDPQILEALECAAIMGRERKLAASPEPEPIEGTKESREAVLPPLDVTAEDLRIGREIKAQYAHIKGGECNAFHIADLRCRERQLLAVLNELAAIRSQPPIAAAGSTDLAKAAKEFMEAVNVCEKSVNNCITVSFVHGVPYYGPDYSAQKAKLAAVLNSLEITNVVD